MSKWRSPARLPHGRPFCGESRWGWGWTMGELSQSCKYPRRRQNAETKANSIQIGSLNPSSRQTSLMVESCFLILSRPRPGHTTSWMTGVIDRAAVVFTSERRECEVSGDYAIDIWLPFTLTASCFLQRFLFCPMLGLCSHFCLERRVDIIYHRPHNSMHLRLQYIQT